MGILGAIEPRPLGALTPEGTVVESRMHYDDPESGLELLCMHAGAGPIAADDRELSLKTVVPL
jgi:hypothetical protein